MHLFSQSLVNPYSFGRSQLRQAFLRDASSVFLNQTELPYDIITEWLLWYNVPLLGSSGYSTILDFCLLESLTNTHLPQRF